MTESPLSMIGLCSATVLGIAELCVAFMSTIKTSELKEYDIDNDVKNFEDSDRGASIKVLNDSFADTSLSISWVTLALEGLEIIGGFVHLILPRGMLIQALCVQCINLVDATLELIVFVFSLVTGDMTEEIINEEC